MLGLALLLISAQSLNPPMRFHEPNNFRPPFYSLAPSAPPGFTSMDPNLGDIWGGSLVTLSGSGLAGVDSVLIGGRACTGITTSNNTVSCYSPAIDAGTGYSVVASISGTRVDGGVDGGFEAWHPTVDYPAARVYQSDRLTTWNPLGYRATQITADRVIHDRDGAGVLSVDGGTFILLGGWYSSNVTAWDGGPTTNEVWRSYDNGVTWAAILGDDHNPPQDGGPGSRWRPRHMGMWTVHVIAGVEYLYVMGGDTLDPQMQPEPADVWRSADQGATWTRMTAQAEWAPRTLGMAWSMSGYLWVAGGQSNPNDPNTGYNDVWRSVDGAAWTQVTNDAGWPSRSDVISPTVWNGRVWIASGELYSSSTHVYRSDVWSSADGITWTQATADAGFGGVGFPNLVAFTGRLFLVRGHNGANRNDIWSTADGVTWTQNAATIDPTVIPADHAGNALVSADGGLVLSGGVASTSHVYMLSPRYGALVSQWDDQGSANYGQVQSATGNMPIYYPGATYPEQIAGPGAVSFTQTDGTNLRWLYYTDAGIHTADIHQNGHVAYVVASTSSNILAANGNSPAQVVIGNSLGATWNEGPGFGSNTDGGALAYSNYNSTLYTASTGIKYTDGQMRLVGVQHAKGGGTDVTLWEGNTQLASAATGGYSTTFTGWNCLGCGASVGSAVSFQGSLGAAVVIDTVPSGIDAGFRSKLTQWSRKWGSISP